MAVPSSDPASWLARCRHSVAGLREVLDAAPSPSQRRTELGTIGKGGDRTLVIDHLAEQRVFDELQLLHDDGLRFTVISEERGVVDFGSRDLFVVVDPLDGSLNAKRGLPSHGLSIAFADGPRMSDSLFGYVYDLGSGDEWYAERGKGAWNAGLPIGPAVEHRLPNGKLELVGVESTDPALLASNGEALGAVANRVRSLGVMAVTICQVASGRIDAAVSLASARSVDVAAAQLIVREAGGIVEFVGSPDGPLEAPLDVDRRFPIIAALSTDAVEGLRTLPIMSVTP